MARHEPESALDEAESAPHAPRRMDRHNSAPHFRHAHDAQRALQHRHFDYNIMWRGALIIAES
ncbi:MAG: hypothetical protein OXI57_08530 [Rhodospirillales bacterium]|nr:hypothetical protein [Rhodospirillales bacterium]